MLFPDGHHGRLVTSHELVRAVLADPRFSARAELQHFPLPGSAAQGPARPAPPGVFTQTDPPEHTRYRHVLTGQFTVRRMRQLENRITEIAAEHLDAMEKAGPPADLVQTYTQPIPSLVICELLGVPYAERDQFLNRSIALMSMTSTTEDKIAAYMGLTAYMAELVAAKRAAPTDDLLSGLLDSDLPDGNLTDIELTNIGFTLLGAGNDTTANMLALGVFALLEHPDQLAALTAEPALVPGAVEELLRYLSIIPCTVRTALEDLELGGELIGAGETVTVSIPAANRDPLHFADPDVLDLHRRTAGHVAFGHGIHQCLGQQLARIEMTVALPALFARFPTLRLDVAPGAVRTRDDMLIYGVHELPVTWDVS
ncbi:cytochrome P450 [Pseudonocardia sp. GCM10023141]|uniref:cytochrome P450 n=1 Tax=Pseudonocardia sp. GCM10023141 TaxID=3252653 RepID=UPI0036231F41